MSLAPLNQLTIDNPLTYLSRKNAHPRDVNIRFQEEGHIYWITGMEGHPTSTTTLIHKFFEPFVPDEVATKMVKGRNKDNETWEYYGMTVEEIKKKWIDSSVLGTDMHQAIEDYINLEACPKGVEIIPNFTLPTPEEIDSRSNSSYNSNSSSDPDPDPDSNSSNSSSSDAECIKFKVPAVPEEKKKEEWNLPRLPPVASQTKEFDYFLKFWADLKKRQPGIEAYRTEWLVYDLFKRVSGSIDLTMRAANGKLRLYDWKRSKGINKEGYKGKKGKSIFSHLDDCNFTTYSIQLNIYRHYLETNYGEEIEYMALVVLHPTNDEYIEMEVSFMQEEVDALWNLLPLSPEDAASH